MKFIGRVLLPLALVASAVLFCRVAFADEGGPDSPQSLAALWPMLGVSLASLAAYGIRKLSAEYTFFHSGAGAFALALLGSVISSVTPVIQAHGFAWAALAWAAVGGLTSFVATLNPSTTADQPPAKSPAAAKLTMFLPLVFLSLFVSGCPSAGGQALKNCELGQLPAAEQSIIAEVGIIIMNPAAVVADLVALAAQLGPGQVACAVQAWDAFLASKQPATVGGLMAATTIDQRAHALSLTRAYLAQHPATACSRKMRAGVERSTRDFAIVALVSRRPDVLLRELVALAVR
jgi:hypothetical protein